MQVRGLKAHVAPLQKGRFLLLSAFNVALGPTFVALSCREDRTSRKLMRGESAKLDALVSLREGLIVSAPTQHAPCQRSPAFPQALCAALAYDTL